MRSFACWFSLLVTLQLGACTSLLFYPQRELVLTPDRVGLAYRDVWFKAADGTRLHGWFLPAGMNVVRGEACTVLFLHGNAENISTHIGNVAWLPGKGYNVFLFDYRGYGRSAGEPLSSASWETTRQGRCSPPAPGLLEAPPQPELRKLSYSRVRTTPL